MGVRWGGSMGVGGELHGGQLGAGSADLDGGEDLEEGRVHALDVLRQRRARVAAHDHHLQLLELLHRLAEVEQVLAARDEAVEALEHGVALTIIVELELHDESSLVMVGQDAKAFQLRYLPLSERYQLSRSGEADIRVFPRLRHLLAEMGNLTVIPFKH